MYIQFMDCLVMLLTMFPVEEVICNVICFRFFRAFSSICIIIMSELFVVHQYTTLYETVTNCK